MSRAWAVAALAAASLVLATATAATPSRIYLTVTPSAVHRGHSVLIRGNADGCPVGDTVFIISRAFPRTYEFAGVPVVLTKVRAGGAFRASTRIPLRRRAGRYGITARCGGGNLGVLVRLVVVR